MASPKPVVAPKPAAPNIPAVIAKPTAPKSSGGYSGIPAVIAKPAAPTFPQTLNLYGTPASGGYSGIPTTAAANKPVTGGQSSNQAAIDKALAGIKSDFEKLKELGKTLTGGTTVVEPPSPPPDEGGGEDPALAYAKMQDEKAKRNAFALLKDVFTQYGLSELATTLETLMKEGYEAEEAALALKTDVRYNAPYIKRFRGNELRRSAGLNVLSEAEYLALEDDYTKTLKSYGLENYFGVDRSLKQTAMADVIGADISALEFTDRVSTAVDRVKMADPGTKNAFQQFYGIGEADLVQYFLDPKKALVNLKEKATAAEIGGAAIGQGLAATMTSAEDLARFGINRQQAQVGYATIGEELPIAGSLGRIYSESGITYNQADAESATFKGLASAKRKKEQLKQLEEGQFSGSAGTSLGAGALSTQYLRKSSSAGQF
jgi:hypothetical protein